MNNNIFDLTNKVAIITGGTGWLGFNFAKILAQYNASIIITTRDLNTLSNTVNN